MEKHGKAKLLIFSVSVLILLIIIYSGFNGKKSDSEGPTAASIVRECAEKFGAFSENVYKSLKSKIEIKIEEIKVKREEEKLKKLEEIKEVSSNDEDNEEEIILEEPLHKEDFIVENSYPSPFELNLPNGMDVPAKIGKSEFRRTKEFVYASNEAGLYNDPAFEGGPVRKAMLWEAFLRIGISNDCCYQLVSEDGTLFYADGKNFKRFREDMELTEEINLEKERVVLDVSYISQYPSLPNGCEITSLATVLNYLEFDVKKEELSDRFLPKAKVGEANFYEEFVGDPKEKDAYGCYAQAIVIAGNAYLKTMGSQLKAINYTGSSFTDMLKKVKEGKPVIVWASSDMNSDPGYTTEWIVNGEYIIWKANMHCMVLIGYDTQKETVVVSDPMVGIKEYEMETFIKRYKQFYSQAVVLE